MGSEFATVNATLNQFFSLYAAYDGVKKELDSAVPKEKHRSQYHLEISDVHRKLERLWRDFKDRLAKSSPDDGSALRLSTHMALLVGQGGECFDSHIGDLKAYSTKAASFASSSWSVGKEPRFEVSATMKLYFQLLPETWAATAAAHTPASYAATSGGLPTSALTSSQLAAQMNAPTTIATTSFVSGTSGIPNVSTGVNDFTTPLPIAAAAVEPRERHARTSKTSSSATTYKVRFQVQSLSAPGFEGEAWEQELKELENQLRTLGIADSVPDTVINLHVFRTDNRGKDNEMELKQMLATMSLPSKSIVLIARFTAPGEQVDSPVLVDLPGAGLGAVRSWVQAQLTNPTEYHIHDRRKLVDIVRKLLVK